jgi:hypothetical protein
VATGHIRPVAVKKSSPRLWTETEAFGRGVEPASFGFRNGIKWREGRVSVAQSGDECGKGTWVFFRNLQAWHPSSLPGIILTVFDGNRKT